MRRLRLEGGPEEVVEAGGLWVLVDCGDGLAARWRDAGLPPTGPDLVLLRDGSAARCAGLPGLLAMPEGREAAVTFVAHLANEAVPALIEAGLRAFEVNHPVCMEPERPGAVVQAGGGLSVRLLPRGRGLGFTVSLGDEALSVEGPP